MALKLIGPPERPEGVRSTPTPLPGAPSAPDGTRLLLVRHARVADSFSAVAYGAQDVPLAPEGVEATERLGASFGGTHVDRVLCSDLERAHAMGRGIASSTGAELVVTPALREVDRGEWQGIPRDDFIAAWNADAERYWRDPWGWRAPGGEGDLDLWNRGGAALREGLAAVDGGTLVVAAHTNLIRVLLGVLMRTPTPDNYAFETGPARLHLLVHEGGVWRHAGRDLGAPPRD